MLQLSFIFKRALLLLRGAIVGTVQGAFALVGLLLLLAEICYLATLALQTTRIVRMGATAAPAGRAADALAPAPSTSKLFGNGKKEARTPDQRRAYRLAPLTDKYAEHARYWQFAVWFRVLAFVACDVFIVPDLMDGAALPYIQAGSAAAVLFITLVLHILVRPFAQNALPGVSQNALESGLLINNILQLLTACLFHYLRTGSSRSASIVVDVILTVDLVAPAVVVAYIVIRSQEVRQQVATELTRAVTRRTRRNAQPKEEGVNDSPVVVMGREADMSLAA